MYFSTLQLIITSIDIYITESRVFFEIRQILAVLRQNIPIRIPFFIRIPFKIPFDFKGPPFEIAPPRFESAARLPAVRTENLSTEEGVSVPTRNLTTEVFRCERVTLTLPEQRRFSVASLATPTPICFEKIDLKPTI